MLSVLNTDADRSRTQVCVTENIITVNIWALIFNMQMVHLSCSCLHSYNLHPIQAVRAALLFPIHHWALVTCELMSWTGQCVPLWGGETNCDKSHIREGRVSSQNHTWNTYFSPFCSTRTHTLTNQVHPWYIMRRNTQYYAWTSHCVCVIASMWSRTWQIGGLALTQPPESQGQLVFIKPPQRPILTVWAVNQARLETRPRGEVWITNGGSKP